MKFQNQVFVNRPNEHSRPARMAIVTNGCKQFHQTPDNLNNDDNDDDDDDNDNYDMMATAAKQFGAFIPAKYGDGYLSRRRK